METSAPDFEQENLILLNLIGSLMAHPIEGFEYKSFNELISEDPRLGVRVHMVFENQTPIEIHLYHPPTASIDSGFQILAEHLQGLRNFARQDPQLDFRKLNVQPSNDWIATDRAFFVTQLELQWEGVRQNVQLISGNVFNSHCRVTIKSPQGEFTDLRKFLPGLSRLLEDASQRVLKTFERAG